MYICLIPEMEILFGYSLDFHFFLLAGEKKRWKNQIEIFGE